MPVSSSYFLRDLASILLLCVLLFGAQLGARVYSVPSEARYVEIGREMAESHDYVTPRLNGVKYFEKPPLFYWAQAAWTEAFGLGFLTSRLPTMLFAAMLCLVTYWLGVLHEGRLTGLLSAGLIATSLYLFALSRVVLLDVPLSVFLCWSLTAFYALIRQARARPLLVYGMYASAALAMLTKGLIAVALPGMIVLCWLIATRRFSLLKSLRIPSGLLLFCAVALPWHLLVTLRHPEFPRFYFIHEHFERYTSKVHGRDKPVWFFSVVLLAGLFPWVAFLVQGLSVSLQGAWQNRKTEGGALFLGLWAFLVLLFFSLSDSQLIPYILPAFPPICVLMGSYFALAWRKGKAPWFGAGLSVLILLLLALASAPSIMPQFFDPDSKVMAAVAQAGDSAQIFALVAIVAAGMLLVAWIQGRGRHLILALFVAAVALLETGDLVAAHYGKDSMQMFASIIKEAGGSDAEVATYHNYYQDLPIYLGRKVDIVAWQGELEFGAQHEDVSRWMLDESAFWRRWTQKDKLMFMVLRDDIFDRLVKEKTPLAAWRVYPLRAEGRNLLCVNQPPEFFTSQKVKAHATH